MNKAQIAKLNLAGIYYEATGQCLREQDMPLVTKYSQALATVIAERTTSPVTMTTNTTPSTASQAPAVSIPESIEELEDFIHKATGRFIPEDVMIEIMKLNEVISLRAYCNGKNAMINHIRSAEMIAENAIDRATAAEAKLEAIRRGVRECVGFGFDKDGPNWISRHQVLALLQPQLQADESGLPG